MPTFLDDQDRQTILGRLAQLDPERPGLWGKMNAGEMICHLGDQMRVALGDLPSRQQGNLFTRSLLKWAIVYLPIKAPPGKIPTVREMKTTKPASWDDDLAELRALVERLPETDEVFPHPVFGNMSKKQWGRLAASHFDHHLRQFGV